MKREEIIEQGMRLLKDVHENEHFRTVDGRMLKSVRELVLLLETYNDEHFRHHVNEHRNDFAEWVRHSVGDSVLADRIAQSDSQSAIQRAISQRLEDLEAMLLSYEMEPLPERTDNATSEEQSQEPEPQEEHSTDDELEALVGDAHSGDKFSRDDLLEEIENAISQAQAQIEIERQAEMRAAEDLTGEPEQATVDSPAERRLERDAEKARKKEEKAQLKRERKNTKTEQTRSNEKGFSFTEFLYGFGFGAVIGGVLGALIVILLGG